MVELLQNKNSATRFQIMLEIAASRQNIHQKDIAAKLGVSPQAISDYIQQLTNEELIEIVDRSAYKVSVKGVNWMLKMLREINDY
ncbi:MAG: winged helix-turn-helix transcriptional regulator, partial [Dehalococcoidales bacterium]|nr:winged helix-turn-helix transcriptional regulator [Dehalococcoidales bacterium]